MTRLYESRCRMCSQTAVLHGRCQFCGTPHPTANDNPPVLDPVPLVPPDGDPDAPESRTDAPARDLPPEGHGPYDDDYPDDRFDLGPGG